MNRPDFGDGALLRPAREAQPGSRDSRAVEMIEERLLGLLQRPDITPGNRLPTERALAQEYDVSRNLVRRAFARLEAHGKVVRIIGSGTYVAEPSRAPDASRVSARKDYSPQEIMQARMMIEPRFATLIIMNANAADFDALAEAKQEAEASHSFKDFEYWDGRFHQLLAVATHNSLVIDIYGIITDSRDTVEWGELKKNSITDERRRKYEEEHQSIFDALQARNANKAEIAIRAHLSGVQQNLFGI